MDLNKETVKLTLAELKQEFVNKNKWYVKNIVHQNLSINCHGKRSAYGDIDVMFSHIHMDYLQLLKIVLPVSIIYMALNTSGLEYQLIVMDKN